VRHRLPFRRGYLFYGPPGNGKTSAIRVMASHPAISAFTLDFSNAELGNEALAEVFEAAGRNAPALVLFEDLDRLFGPRFDEHHPDNRTRITFQHVLNCLDGLGSQEASSSSRPRTTLVRSIRRSSGARTGSTEPSPSGLHRQTSAGST
jgi:SpoVK/Ycf46/Vps4 family AAA+-type ATPase